MILSRVGLTEKSEACPMSHSALECCVRILLAHCFVVRSTDLSSDMLEFTPLGPFLITRFRLSMGDVVPASIQLVISVSHS